MLAGRVKLCPKRALGLDAEQRVAQRVVTATFLWPYLVLC